MGYTRFFSSGIWATHIDNTELFKNLLKQISVLTFCLCFSFGAGFLGSLVYVRMLGSSVDSMADGAKGLIKYASDLLFDCVLSYT